MRKKDGRHPTSNQCRNGAGRRGLWGQAGRGREGSAGGYIDSDGSDTARRRLLGALRVYMMGEWVWSGTLAERGLGVEGRGGGGRGSAKQGAIFSINWESEAGCGRKRWRMA